jgi:hypothetical protein
LVKERDPLVLPLPNLLKQGLLGEVRAHLGVETQRQWPDKAIARATPCLLDLYSIVTLLAQPLFATGRLFVRSGAWYPKPQATFSDTIASVRRW